MSVDWVLLQQYYQGDRTSIEELIERHLPSLVKWVPRFDYQPEKVSTFLNRYLGQLPLQKRRERVKANSDSEVRKSLEVMTKNVQDRLWVNDYCRGKDEAISLLFDRYTRRLVLTSIKVVKREEAAQDIVANLQWYFLQLPVDERKAKFGQGRITCVQPFLMRATKNRSIDWLRRSKKITLPGEEVIHQNRVPFEEKQGLSEYDEAKLKLVHLAVSILPAEQQTFFEYWRKGIPNETIENEIHLVQGAHHVKEAIRRHVANYERSKEDIYMFLLRSSKYAGQTNPSQALEERAKILLEASDFHYFLQFRDEHLAEKTTKILNTDHMKEVVTIKRRIKKTLINGN